MCFVLSSSLASPTRNAFDAGFRSSRVQLALHLLVCERTLRRPDKCYRCCATDYRHLSATGHWQTHKHQKTCSWYALARARESDGRNNGCISAHTIHIHLRRLAAVVIIFEAVFLSSFFRMRQHTHWPDDTGSASGCVNIINFASESDDRAEREKNKCKMNCATKSTTMSTANANETQRMRVEKERNKKSKENALNKKQMGGTK